MLASNCMALISASLMFGATECPPDIQRPAKHEQVAIFRQKNERIANVFRNS